MLLMLIVECAHLRNIPTALIEGRRVALVVLVILQSMPAPHNLKTPKKTRTMVGDSMRQER